MASTLHLAQVVIDCEDPPSLAAFWSALVGRPIDPGANQWYALVPASPDRTFPSLMFLKVPEPRAGKNRWHLDLVSADRHAEVDRAVELGARRIGDFDEYETKWTTLADPEGNLFDIGSPHG